MEVPKYLYHYTTMDTARLILENRTIRFNNLNKTDDVLESQTADAGIAGKYIFVSCWTPNPTENIALWTMYSKGFSGVRLRMKFDPFMDFVSKLKEMIPRENIHEGTSEKTKDPVRIVIPIEHMLSGKYICQTPFTSSIDGYESCVVKYTDDINLLKPKIIEQVGTTISYNYGAVGEYKSKEWEIQNEVRYRIIVVPIKIFEFINGGLGRDSAVYKGFMSMLRNEELPLEYIDLHIDGEAYEDMEIMIGPKVKCDEREDFIKFVKEKNPCCKIVESNLQLRNHI